MSLDQRANFIRDNLSSSVSNSTNTFPVNDASVFPDPTNGEYNLVVWDVDNYNRPDQDPDVEIVRCTGRNTEKDDLTVSRGQESTSAVSHPSNSALMMSPTAKMFTDIESSISEKTTKTDTYYHGGLGL